MEMPHIFPLLCHRQVIRRSNASTELQRDRSKHFPHAPAPRISSSFRRTRFPQGVPIVLQGMGSPAEKRSGGSTSQDVVLSSSSSSGSPLLQYFSKSASASVLPPSVPPPPIPPPGLGASASSPPPSTSLPSLLKSKSFGFLSSPFFAAPSAAGEEKCSIGKEDNVRLAATEGGFSPRQILTPPSPSSVVRQQPLREGKGEQLMMQMMLDM